MRPDHPDGSFPPLELEALSYLLLGSLRQEVAGAASPVLGEFPWLCRLVPPRPQPRAREAWLSASLALGLLASGAEGVWAQERHGFAFEWDEAGMVVPDPAPARLARGEKPARRIVIETMSASPVGASRAPAAQAAEHLRVALRRHAHRSYAVGRYRVAHPRVKGWRYVVRPGDSLWRIARRLLGSGLRWRELWASNRDRVRDPDLIFSGQVLRLPEGPRPKSAWLDGHRRVGRSFYVVRAGVLVWADTGAPVRAAGPRIRVTWFEAEPARAARAAQPPATARTAPNQVSPRQVTIRREASRPPTPAKIAVPTAVTGDLREVERPVEPRPLESREAERSDEMRATTFKPTPLEATGLALILPASAQWARGDRGRAAAFAGAEVAALGALGASYLTGSRELWGVGLGMLITNHVLSGADAYLSAEPQR